MKKEYLVLKVNEKKERIYLKKLWKELKPENNLYIFLTDIFFYEDMNILLISQITTNYITRPYIN